MGLCERGKGRSGVIIRAVSVNYFSGINSVLLIIFCGIFLFAASCTQAKDKKDISVKSGNERAISEDFQNIEVLFESGFDMRKFARRKNYQANSGSGGREDYYWKPEYKGFYWAYFLFPPCGESSAEIITFKKGKEIGGFMDKDEEFISVSSRCADPDLGAINFVKRNIKEFEDAFGKGCMRNGNIYLYQSSKQNMVLVLYAEESVITYFQMAKLNYRLNDMNDFPKGLIPDYVQRR